MRVATARTTRLKPVGLVHATESSWTNIFMHITVPQSWRSAATPQWLSFALSSKPIVAWRRRPRSATLYEPKLFAI